MPRTPRSAEAIAQAAVAQWATGIMTSMAALSGETTGPHFDRIVDTVREAVLHEDPEHRQATPHQALIEEQLQAMLPPEGWQLLLELENANARDYLAAQEAAYIIGVQIGLRLAGGVR